MKKARYRDYATAAFREWAAEGCPVGDALKKCGGKRGRVLDMRACAESMENLRSRGRGDVCAAVEYVYMLEDGADTKRGEISARVVRYSMEHYISERQVYEHLMVACREFAVCRGLNVE